MAVISFEQLEAGFIGEVLCPKLEPSCMMKCLNALNDFAADQTWISQHCSEMLCAVVHVLDLEEESASMNAFESPR